MCFDTKGVLKDTKCDVVLCSKHSFKYQKQTLGAVRSHVKNASALLLIGAFELLLDVIVCNVLYNA